MWGHSFSDPGFLYFPVAARRGRTQAELSGLVALRMQKSEVEEVEEAGFVGQWTKEQGAMHRKSARNLPKSPR